MAPMPPKNVAALFAKFRKQARAAKPYAFPNSAYAQAEAANIAYRAAHKRTHSGTDSEKQGKPKTVKTAAPQPAVVPKPKQPTPEPVVECWRLAGGAIKLGRKPRYILAIARVPTLCLPTFRPAVEALVKKHGGKGDIVTLEKMESGESWTDVCLKMSEDSMVAVTMLMHDLHGEIVEGRMLQVDYA
ncbi:hypothetical protein LTR53_005823 [Teratosphaeriaceae sp. CCFEE 6253]|nr:hypothetical protein LTR53_005823 [Teratosphaeriaceae sp. CCFEE 6253]